MTREVATAASDAATTSLALSTDPLTDRARTYARAALAPNTRRAYAIQWQAFTAWCEARGISSLPALADDVARYLAALGGQRAPATLDVLLAAIAKAHVAAGFASPCAHSAVRLVRRGIRRTEGTAGREAAPLLVDDVRRLVVSLGDAPIERRDRALLLLGWAGALRRSEIVALDLVDVRRTHEGLEVKLRRSKTDQEGTGRLVGVPAGEHADTCPVHALEAWLALRGDAPGALFVGVTRWGALTGFRLAGGDVARLVKRRAAAAGLDPRPFSGHSLRAGLVTSAAEAGKPLKVIMDQTGQRSTTTVLRYIRRAGLFRTNAAAGLGL